MAFLEQPFSIDDVPESTGDLDPIPAGNYQVRVVSAEPKTTKAGTGEYLACRLDVIGPTHQGRVLWCNVNYRNPNPTAQSIGQQQLGQLMRANGVRLLEDSDQLIGGVLTVTVAISRDERYGDRNEVKKLKAANNTPAVAAPSAPPAAEKSAGSRPPWKK